MKLKDNKSCQCLRREHETSVTKTCRSGYCTFLLCTTCGMPWVDWGPVACPHKKNENGTLRWYKYPDMDEKHPVAIKRSILMRKRNQPRK